jgi:YVTN family beta-propeller protein
MNRKMKRLSRKLIAALFATTLPIGAQAQNQLVDGKKITLPPIGTITQPLPGAQVYNGFIPNIGSHPASLVASPNGKFAVTSDLGFREYLSSVNTTTGQLVSQLGYGPPYVSGTFGLFYGVAFSPVLNGSTYTLYAAQGNNNTIAILNMDANTGALSVVMSAGKAAVIKSATNYDFPAGLAVSADGKYLYVANHQAKTTNNAGSLSIFDTTTGTQVGRLDFTAANGFTSVVSTPAYTGAAAGTASSFPYAIAVSKDGSKVYVGASSSEYVYSINVTTPAAPHLAAEIHTGSHPDGLLVSGNTLYVSNAHSDTVSVVDVSTDTVTDTIDLRPAGAKSVVGVTPNQLAISPDKKTLYVALSDMHAVAEIDTAGNTIKGEIPVGWYPTGVVATNDGQRILVANARGTQTRYPNPDQTDYTAPYAANVNNGANEYTLTQIEANVETIQVPSSIQLLKYTLMVLSNNRITPNTDNTAINPLYNISKAKGGIQHIFYIIRENRTYDQELGDVAAGNGDPSLVLFGQAVTPNVHNFQQQYVLLDNFYDMGDASMAGWDWSTTGLNNEHMARNQPYNYSSRGSQYDSEGTVNNYPVGGLPANALGYPGYSTPAAYDPSVGGLSRSGIPGTSLNAPVPYDGTVNTFSYKPTVNITATFVVPNGVALPPIPDAGGHPNGRIFDTMVRAGNTIRDYGALYNGGWPSYATIQPGGHYDATMGVFSPAVSGNTDEDYSPYDNNYAESPAPYVVAATTAPNVLNGGKFLPPHQMFGAYKSTNRFDEWNREFQAMIANDPTGATVPNFELIRMGRDHNNGVNANAASAKAMVSDNDFAVGKLVEAISHSPIWAHSAIFILEDDAQAGPDHVDSHRSVGFVISPYVKQGSHSTKFYNTASFLHNMELLLNAAPLTQFDAIADYIDAWDTAPNNNAPYTAVMPAANIVGEVLSAGMYETKLEKQEFKRLMALASKMDWVHADANDPALMNEMIWKSVKGMTSKLPASKNTGPIDSLMAKRSARAAKTGKATVKTVRDSDDD